MAADHVADNAVTGAARLAAPVDAAEPAPPVDVEALSAASAGIAAPPKNHPAAFCGRPVIPRNCNGDCTGDGDGSGGAGDGALASLVGGATRLANAPGGWPVIPRYTDGFLEYVPCCNGNVCCNGGCTAAGPAAGPDDGGGSDGGSAAGSDDGSDDTGSDDGSDDTGTDDDTGTAGGSAAVSDGGTASGGGPLSPPSSESGWWYVLFNAIIPETIIALVVAASIIISISFVDINGGYTTGNVCGTNMFIDFINESAARSIHIAKVVSGPISALIIGVNVATLFQYRRILTGRVHTPMH